MDTIEVNVQERVLRPVGEVFQAVVDPARMSNYFISRGSGPLKAGARVEWEFADVGAKVSVDVLEVKPNGKVVLVSDAPPDLKTRTTIAFKPEGEDATVITVNEAEFPLDRAGVLRAMGQTGGWTYFLACLKAYVTHGVNLRAGLNKRITDV